MTRAERSDPHCRWPDGVDSFAGEAPWRRIAVLGDSIAAGTTEPVGGYSDVDAISRVLRALRGDHWPIRTINLGEPGLRLSEIIDRQLPTALRSAPDLAIIGAGGNDALSRHFDPARAHDELTALVAPLAAAGAQIVTIGLFDLPRSGLIPDPPASAMATRLDQLDELTARVAGHHGGVHTANHRHPLAADPTIFASDGIHANARGHAIAAATLITALMQLRKQ